MSGIVKLMLLAVGQGGEGLYQRTQRDRLPRVIPTGRQHRPAPDIQQQERDVPAGKLALQNSGSRLREQANFGRSPTLCERCHW